MSVKFELPDKYSRAQIFKRYAKQLEKKELEKLADLSEGMSGRNISDICKGNFLLLIFFFKIKKIFCWDFSLKILKEILMFFFSLGRFGEKMGFEIHQEGG
jgi:hypothetical protein